MTGRRYIARPGRGGHAFTLALAAVIAIVAAPAFAQQAGGDGAAPPGVIVETVVEREVAGRVSFTGRIEAIDSVSLRARVAGFLGPRQFEEGAEIEDGTLLFVIEKAPYEAAVAQAEAGVASARATVELARVTFKRTKTLADRKAVSQAQLDEARAKLGEAEAALQGQEATLQVARLNLSYTEISAPMAGRIGRSGYSEGDLVGPDSDPLATLVAENPMYVAFPVPTRILLAVHRSPMDRDSVIVRLRLPDGSIYEHAGAMRFDSVQANPSTDTVTVRASMPNPDRILTDRQLVGVIVEAKEPERKLVVSQSALVLDQQGSYVLLVDDENKVEPRRVELGAQEGTGVVIEKGLAAGDRVIVSGLQKVRPGMTVDPYEASDPASGQTGG